MRAAESNGAGPLERTVLEVMGSLMAPDRAERLLARALAVRGWRSVPKNPAAVRELALGPLRDIIAEDIGVDVAAFVCGDLAPILDLAASRARHTCSHSRVRAQRSTPPPPTDVPAEKLRIAVATLGSLEDFKRHIGPFADVMRVRDAFELFALIDARRGPLLVVIDGHRPAVELSTLAMLMSQIPDGCRMILWGFEAPEIERFLVMDRWSTVSAGSGWLDLAGALRDFS